MYEPKNPAVAQGIEAAVDLDAASNTEYMKGITEVLAVLESSHPDVDDDLDDLEHMIRDTLRRRGAIETWRRKADDLQQERDTALWHMTMIERGADFQPKMPGIGRHRERYVIRDENAGTERYFYPDGTTETKEV